jgi:putative hydrolase of HD superfamily
MERLARFIFEALFLKHVQRSGYQFLGAGRESVAEHVYAATIIAFILSKLEPRANAERLFCMCLFHDLPEARIGDLNYVQKHYVQPDESSALADATRDLPFGSQIEALLEEFNAAESLEAQLAHDADQMALMVDLKQLKDLGYQTPQQWLPHIEKRLHTQTARRLAGALLDAPRDEWWLKIFC